MPATSPTLSPTLSAIVAGFRGIVFGDVGFHLPDQVGSDIGRLRVDATADASEEGLCRGPHAERNHRRRDLDQLLRIGTTLRAPWSFPTVSQPFAMLLRREDELIENEVPGADVEQPESDHDQPHDGAGAKSDLQAAVQSLGAALGGPGRGGRGRPHADVAAKTGEKAARQKGDRHKRILDAQLRQPKENDHEDQERRG